SLSFALTDENCKETDEDRQFVLNQYLQDTKLLPVLNSWVVLIAGLEELPYNPYPTLVWYARRHAERFHMFKEDEDAIFHKIEVFVPQFSDHSWFDTRWTHKSITENEKEFLSLVELAAKGQQFVIAEVTLLFNWSSTVSESSMPYRSAYEGVFESHSSFVNYLAWFENVQRPENTPEFREPTASTTKSESRHSKKQNTNPPSVNPSMYVPSSTRADLGGFVSGTTDSSVYQDDGPYADNIQENIRKFLSYKISSLPREENLFAMLHYVILLLLLDIDSEEAQDGLVEAARLLQSTLYNIHSLMNENSLLQGLVHWFSSIESNDAYVVQTFYIQFREHLKDLLCNDLQERSSEFTVAGCALLDILDAITHSPSSRASQSKELVTLPLSTQVRTNAFGTFLPNDRHQGTVFSLCFQVIKELQLINRYCTTIMLGLVDDTLNFCPTLRTMIFIIKLLVFQHYFPPINTAGHSLRTSYNFKHGVEFLSILSQDNMYMNKEQAKNTIPAPSSISRQATILKYFVDVKLDQAFEEFLGHVLSGSALPPNPYPRLVTHLRDTAVRMELFGEKQEKLVPRLLPGSAQIVDTKNYIYSCPGSDANGLISAVSAIDSKHYNALLSKLNVVHNNVSSRVTDAGIKATVGLALTGFSPLYGRMMPYINQIELEEHYFLQGPVNAKMDVMNYFTKLGTYPPLKVVYPSLKVVYPPLKVVYPPLKVVYPSLKVVYPPLKVVYPPLKVVYPSLKVVYPPLKVVYPPLKVVYPSLKVVYPPLKVVYPPLKVVYPSLKVVYPSLKVVYPPLKVVYPPLKVVYPPLKVVYIPLKVVYPPLKVVYPSLKVVYPSLKVVYPPLKVVYPSLKVVYPPLKVVYPPLKVVYYPPLKVVYPPLKVVYPPLKVVYPPLKVVYPPLKVVYPPPKVVYPPLKVVTWWIYDHLVGFAEESSILFVGMFLGEFSVRRSLLDIVPPHKKNSFMSQLLTNVKNEKPVYMKAYIQMDWRLVLVKKTFLLHYIQGQFQGYRRFYKPSPLSYYQNVFSSQAAASLFARACGPQDRSDPCQGESLRTSLVHVNHFIESARHDGDLLSVYRWLLVKSLMSQSTLHVAEAWYMFHSAAAQLEYLITLNKTLQNLVYEELSRTFAPATEDTADTGIPVILQEINELLQPLLDASAHDIHH
ncbi:hypothetical protein QZH41_018992, partial [Actinostola sp. cb2023]